MSAAYKYAALQTFCIPTEGDHDADAVTPEPVPAPAKDVAERLALLEHPAGYVAWFETLRAAAMVGTPALERAWFDAPMVYRQHLTMTAPAAKDELKLIAGRMVGTGGRAS